LLNERADDASASLGFKKKGDGGHGNKAEEGSSRFMRQQYRQGDRQEAIVTRRYKACSRYDG
jgi:hypothetical protein